MRCVNSGNGWVHPRCFPWNLSVAGWASTENMKLRCVVNDLFFIGRKIQSRCYAYASPMTDVFYCICKAAEPLHVCVWLFTAGRRCFGVSSVWPEKCSWSQLQYFGTSLAFLHSLGYSLVLIGGVLETFSTFGGHVWSPLRAPIDLDPMLLKDFPWEFLLKTVSNGCGIILVPFWGGLATNVSSNHLEGI